MQKNQRKQSPAERIVVHRTPRYVWIVTIAAFSVVLALTAVAFIVKLKWWYQLGFVAFSTLFIIAFVELSQRCVTIDAENLTFVNNFRRRVISRIKIESVRWESGAGVSLKLVDGQWVKLPEVGSSSKGLTNSIRAWLKRTDKRSH